MITLHLHGALARFGSAHKFAACQPVDMIAGLASQIPAVDRALRRGRFTLCGVMKDGTWHPLDGLALYQPPQHANYHLTPVIGGAGRAEGKMLLGLTLLGLAFVPGMQSGVSALMGAGPGGSEMVATMGRRLLGGAATWLIASTSSDALSPQLRQPTGQGESALINTAAPIGEGAAIPMVYGQVRVHTPPVVSAGLSVTLVPLP